MFTCGQLFAYFTKKRNGLKRTMEELITIRGCKGPSIKYVTVEGDGVQEGVTVCDGGSRACDVTLIKKIIIHMKPEI